MIGGNTVVVTAPHLNPSSTAPMQAWTHESGPDYQTLRIEMDLVYGWRPIGMRSP